MKISDITIGNNRRTVNQDKILSLKESIKEIGLQNPITVRPDGFLIGGLHRLEAYKLLGHEEISVTVVDLDDLRAELAEIDENLIRDEGVVLWRSDQFARRKAIYLELYPETKQGAQGGGKNGVGTRTKTETTDSTLSVNKPKRKAKPKSFVADTSEKIGKSKSTVYQEVKISEDLSAEAKAKIRGTRLEDAKTILLELSRLSKEDQMQCVIWLLEKKSRKVEGWKKEKRKIEHAEQRASKFAEVNKEDFKNHYALYCAFAESLPLENESIDIIITSPPYNLGHDSWPMGGMGATPRENGIGYYDELEEMEYQQWQLEVFKELYRVSKEGASFFYNHKVRQINGGLIHPMDWIRRTTNPWILRQEIVWDRKSTHNHCETLFWPQDERIYWMTKGKPTLPEHPIGLSSVFTVAGPRANTWHPAPFTSEIPAMLLDAVALPNSVVLDPFAGSCTTVKEATRRGLFAIGVDINQEYLDTAEMEILDVLSSK